MLNGNLWIILGVLAGAFSLYAIPHGFQVKDQQRKVKSTKSINIHGDFVNGNKTVIDKYIGVAGSDQSLSEEGDKVDVAKLKIGRAFKDFNL